MTKYNNLVGVGMKIDVLWQDRCRECGSGEFGYDGEHMIKFCRGCGTVEEKEFWHLIA